MKDCLPEFSGPSARLFQGICSTGLLTAAFFIIAAAVVLRFLLPSVQVILFVSKSQNLSQNAQKPAGSEGPEECAGFR